MRRTLAIALAAGVLLLGGCAQRQAPAVSVPAPAATSTKPAEATPAKATPAKTTPADDGVDGLLDEVDKQLSSDGQPAADQD